MPCEFIPGAVLISSAAALPCCYVPANPGLRSLLCRVAGPNDDSHLGGPGDRAPVLAHLRQSVHGRRMLGGTERSRLCETCLRFLGRRRDLSRARGGDRSRCVDLDQRLQPSVRHGPQPEIRHLHRARLDRGRKTGKPEPPWVPALHAQRPRAPVRRRHPVLPGGRHLARRCHLAASADGRRGGPGVRARSGCHLRGRRGVPQAPRLQLGQHDRGLPHLGLRSSTRTPTPIANGVYSGTPGRRSA